MNAGESEWRFSITRCFAGRIDFKVLINDTRWERGANHSVRFGETVEVYY